MRQTQNTQKKDNRKSFFVIGLLLLLVAVIGFGGYTLSKYVTKKDASGNAFVAKWGFTVSADAEKLLGEEYKWDGTNSTVSASGDTVTVKANTAKTNVVAPGTTGSMTFTIDGKAEVKAKIEIKMDVKNDILLNYKQDQTPGSYAPVKWTLKKDNAVVNDKDGNALQNVTLAKIADVLNGYTATVAANATYEHAGTYTIEWAWAFEVDEESDKLDTLLGWTANGTKIPEGYGYTVEDGTETGIEFTLAISATQVKE